MVRGRVFRIEPLQNIEAEAVLAVRRPGRTTRAISAAEFSRASDPPPWGVLDTSRAQAAGVRIRPWEVALEEYLLG